MYLKCGENKIFTQNAKGSQAVCQANAAYLPSLINRIFRARYADLLMKIYEAAFTLAVLSGPKMDTASAHAQRG